MGRLGARLLVLGWSRLALAAGSLGLSVAAVGCAPDNRLGPSLGQALVDGPIRAYASEQAMLIARASLPLAASTQISMGTPRDLMAARAGWRSVRLAYDRGAAFFFVATPALNQALDGRFDDPLATTGLRQLEPALFSSAALDAARIERLGQALATSAVALSNATPDPTNAVTLSALLGSLSAQAAVVATKLDGSDSPYAGASHLSIEHNLVGLQAMYQALAPAVERADPVLHQRATDLLAALLAQVQGLPSVDAVRNKVAFLRDCGELSTAFLAMGTALGLSVSAPVDVT